MIGRFFAARFREIPSSIPGFTGKYGVRYATNLGMCGYLQVLYRRIGGETQVRVSVLFLHLLHDERAVHAAAFAGVFFIVCLSKKTGEIIIRYATTRGNAFYQRKPIKVEKLPRYITNYNEKKKKKRWKMDETVLKIVIKRLT